MTIVEFVTRPIHVGEHFHCTICRYIRALDKQLPDLSNLRINLIILSLAVEPTLDDNCGICDHIHSCG